MIQIVKDTANEAHQWIGQELDRPSLQLTWPSQELTHSAFYSEAIDFRVLPSKLPSMVDSAIVSLR